MTVIIIIIALGRQVEVQRQHDVHALPVHARLRISIQYEELIRLAETRLAQNSLDYSKIAQTTLRLLIINACPPQGYAQSPY